jgi:hypothetical protein
MKTFITIALALLTIKACFADNPADVATWGDMTGKVKNVNVTDFPYSTSNGVGTVSFTGKNGSHSFGAPGIKFDPAQYRGKNLKFTAEIKTTDSKGSSLWMRVDGKKGRLAFDNGAFRNIKGTNDWTTFEVVLPVSNNATQILAGLLHYPGGKMSVRNVVFEVTEAQTTSKSIMKDTFSMNVENWSMAMGHESLYKGSASNEVATIKSLKNNVTKDSFASWNDNFDPKQFIGHRIQFTAEIKTANVTDGYAGLWMRVDGKGDAKKFDNMAERGVREDTDWHRYSVVLDVTDESVTNMAFGLLLVGPGQAWIRNVSLASVSNNIKTTD